MKLTSDAYGKTIAGIKSIESRLYDTKRMAVTVGDEIIFSEQECTSNTVTTRVTELLRYSTFEELFDDNDALLFGNANRVVLLHQVQEIYTNADETKYGVVGIQFELIE